MILAPLMVTSAIGRLLTNNLASATLQTATRRSSMATHGIQEEKLRPETKEQKDKRMAWWREARFGMFIHWGLYAIPAGVWQGKEYPGAAEWLMNTAHIPVAEYEPLMHQFDPVKFDALQWVKLAKEAGMRYIVITSKHHEGFNMFNSHESDYNIMNTPFHRDVMKELAAACKQEGIKFCFYHSIMDWHHPDYAPRRPWDLRPDIPADMDKYVRYLKAELKELLSNYGPIGVLWFDGEWEDTWNHERGVDLYNYVRSLQPNIIVNNRVDKGRADMQGMTKDEQFAGDFGTPEQEIPPNGLPGVDWESCMTMNDTWGYSSHDNNWKSSADLIKNLVDIASKGGNYLLNVGPTSEGLIPGASVERLKAMGAWMKKNSEAIYDTQAGPFIKPLPWGRITQKPGKLYLCVFQSEDGQISLPGLSGDITSIHPLGSNHRITYHRSPDGVVVEVGDHTPDSVDVYELDYRGKLEVLELPILQQLNGNLELKAEDADVHGETAHLEAEKHAIGFWTNSNDWLSWEARVTKPGTFDVTLEFACEPDSQGSDYTVSIGGQELHGHVVSTGSWSDFTTVHIGQISIPHAGDIVCSVKPTSKPALAVMNLRRVVLAKEP